MHSRLFLKFPSVCKSFGRAWFDLLSFYLHRSVGSMQHTLPTALPKLPATYVQRGALERCPSLTLRCCLKPVFSRSQENTLLAWSKWTQVYLPWVMFSSQFNSCQCSVCSSSGDLFMDPLSNHGSVALKDSSGWFIDILFYLKCIYSYNFKVSLRFWHSHKSISYHAL